MEPSWFIGLPAPFELDLTPPPRVSVLHRDDRHVTLAFLGACGEAPARAAWEVAARLELEAVEATLEGTALLGPPRRPSAIAGLVGRGRERLEEAMAARDELRAVVGLPAEERPPLPHVTLARIARRADAAARRAAAQWAESLELRTPPLRLDHLALYTWSEDRRVRRYRVVAQRALTA